MQQHFTPVIDEPKPVIKVSRHHVVVSVTDGLDIRMHDCKSVEAATMLHAQLTADPVAALKWMNHTQSGQQVLPLIGGKLRRTEDQV